MLNKLRDSLRLSSVAALLAGTLLPLAFAPFGYFPLAFLSPMVLFWLWMTASRRQAMFLGWFYGLGVFGVGVSWVFVAIHVFGYTALPLAALMTFLFVAVLAIFFAIQGYFTVRLREWSVQLPAWLYPLVLMPAAWSIQEWVRGWLFTGFPWLNLGYSQTDSWLSAYAPVLGVYGIGLLLVLTSAGLLYALLVPESRLRLVSILAIIWGVGALLQQVEWTAPYQQPLKVSLVQGNVEQISKWDPERVQFRMDTYANLARAHWDSDLIIWPENSITVFYHQLKDGYFAELEKEAQQHNSSIILGLPVLDEKTDNYYSSFMTLGEGQPMFYHKNHLVPFGEYVPLESVFRGLISFLNLPMSGFTPGGDEQAALKVRGLLVAPSICYEDAFGEEMIRFLPAAHLLVNGSNNAWYGDSFAPHQHVQISRMRALETGRDMLRVTTNGISAFITHKGVVTLRSPQFETSVISATATPRTGSTPYVYWGNLPVLVLLAGVVLFTFLYRKK